MGALAESILAVPDTGTGGELALLFALRRNERANACGSTGDIPYAVFVMPFSRR